MCREIVSVDTERERERERERDSERVCREIEKECILVCGEKERGREIVY